MKYDFNVDRNYDSVLIDTQAWVYPDERLIHQYSVTDKAKPTYINNVVAEYIKSEHFIKYKDVLKEGTTILLSRVMSDISIDRQYRLEDKFYCSAPVTQVLGYFKDNKVSLDNLTLLYDKVLIERVNIQENSYIKQADNDTLVGKVIKVGTNAFSKDWKPVPLTVKEGDIVLIRDNVATKITLDNKEYYVVEEGHVVGIFKDTDFSIDNLNIINNYMIMDEYTKDLNVDDSIINTRLESYEDLDYSSFNNDNIFIIENVDAKLTKLNKYDKVLVNRWYTHYMYFKTHRYYVISGDEYIEAKIA